MSTERYARLLAAATPEQLAEAAAKLDPADAALLDEQMSMRVAQCPPPGDWSTWLILAGRGFGKTRTGAAWIDGVATSQTGSRIALIGPTAADARAVMVEGEAGLLANNPGIRFSPALRRLEWPGGSVAMLYSAVDAEAVRGPSFHLAWGDEAARWDRGDTIVANLRMALRLGPWPRLLLTTTPRPLDWLKKLSGAPGVATTRGRTHDNAAHLPPPYIVGLERHYAGTRLGRQELDGEFIEDREGALWTRALIEACRIGTAPPCVRIVVGVDPPASVGGRANACGIVVAGIDARGQCYVLADRSVQGLTPNGWGRAVVAAADAFDADLVVAEVNNGGAMVAEIIHGVDAGLNVRSVIVTSAAETVAAVGKIKAAGLWGVKFYTSMNPAWIAPAAAEAHRHGLHVHGHVPAGMRPLEAVRAGYDEISHINFIMMQAMPQAVVDKANTAARLEGPAKYGKDVDLDSPAMKAFYAELAKRGTIIDPTLTVWEPLLTSDGSVIAPSYAPFAEISPPSVTRGWKTGGYPLFEGVTREDFRKSFAKMVGVVGKLHQAGVPIVAGTDGYGLELVRELNCTSRRG